MYKTITLSLAILFLSAGVAFACIPQVTPPVNDTITPTTVPSVVLSQEPSVVPTVAPTIEVSPTATTEAKVEEKHVDVSDGRSDGLHTAPDGLGCATHECKAIIPQGAPNTGRGL